MTMGENFNAISFEYFFSKRSEAEGRSEARKSFLGLRTKITGLFQTSVLKTDLYYDN